VGTTGDKGLLKEIRNLLKRALKSHKDGNLTAAISQIRMTHRRIDEVVADPLGPAIGSRKSLMANAEQYRTDAVELVQLLGDLPNKASERVPGIAPEVLTQLGKVSEATANLIHADALIGHAARLDDPDAADTVLRERREGAMAKTRQLREQLLGHPLMVQLAATPLNRTIPAVMKRLLQHINRFEANVSRAVK